MFDPKEYFEAGFNQCRIKSATLLEQRYFQDELGRKVRMLEPEFPDTECDSCEVGPGGHEYDCPAAQD